MRFRENINTILALTLLIMVASFQLSTVVTVEGHEDIKVVQINSLDELQTVLSQAFVNRETNVQFVYTGASKDLQQTEELINSIMAQDDYLQFNIIGWGFDSNGTEGDNQVNLNVSYLTTLDQEKYVDQKVDEILSTVLEVGMNPDQKVKAIHDYIVLNVAYDQTMTGNSAYAALNKGQTVCQGYSLLAYKMLTQAGLQARIIRGNAGGEAHAWNMVNLDDEWYHIDFTWDDPVPDVAGRVIYKYYNLSLQEIEIDHQLDGEYVGLPSASASYADTLGAGLY